MRFRSGDKSREDTDDDMSIDIRITHQFVSFTSRSWNAELTGTPIRCLQTTQHNDQLNPQPDPKLHVEERGLEVIADSPE